eukprot:TRINITY_DN8010_c0_g1_i1.p1 TRINITY_DN8010_c0_g1~~TRINITY_DN8010_c0_g1_i1.p1  ORF type:complete len:666 (-),score=139.05 TRINITY_DN8010_c0_g1_i1:40-2037(-)
MEIQDGQSDKIMRLKVNEKDYKILKEVDLGIIEDLDQYYEMGLDQDISIGLSKDKKHKNAMEYVRNHLKEYVDLSEATTTELARIFARWKQNPQTELKIVKASKDSDDLGFQVFTYDDTTLMIQPNRLGSGQFGSVVKAKLLTDAEVCVKLLNAEDKVAIKKEAKLLSFCKGQPHIVNYYGNYISGGKTGLVMELIEPGDLRSLLQSERYAHRELPLPKKITICLHALDGLRFLHGVDIIHGDLALRNLLIKGNINGDDWTVKLSDFGFSHIVAGKKDRVYKLSNKPQLLPDRWIAPEVRDIFQMSFPSDVFSFGVVMWEVFEMGADVPKWHPKTDPLFQERTPPKYYAEMQKCWTTSTEARITTEDLLKHLIEFKNNPGPFALSRLEKGERIDNAMLAKIPETGENVFVKFLPSIAEGAKELRSQRLHNIPELLAKLESHPNIVKFKHTFVEGSSIGMVMELVTPGKNIHQILTDAVRTNSEADIGLKTKLKMCVEALQGLSVLHKHNLVHGDLRLENLLIQGDAGFLMNSNNNGGDDKNWSVKLTDFGSVSQVIGDRSAPLDKDAPLAGRLKWCAPEVLVEARYRFESDIWSFGVVMWELFEMGEHPFESMTESELMRRMLAGVLELSKGQRMTQEYFKVMENCCRIRPEQRTKREALLESMK